MQEILDRYKTGIAISQVTMQNAQPPEQVQAAFDDAVKARQDRERQKNEGQAYANDVVPKARGTASRLLQEAEGYKQRVIANAEGEAARFRQIVDRIQPGAGGDARAPVPRHRAAGAGEHEQGHRRPEGGQQSAVPAARQADAVSAGATAAAPPEDGERAARCGDATTPLPPSAVDTRSRDAFRSREREPRP